MLHKAGESSHSITSGGDKKLVETHILTHLGEKKLVKTYILTHRSGGDSEAPKVHRESQSHSVRKAWDTGNRCLFPVILGTFGNEGLIRVSGSVCKLRHD